MGSDNLIKFHKWDGSNNFRNLCNIVVFSRKGYSKKTLKHKIYKFLGKDKVIFLKSKIVNISSSKIRENYLV